MEEINGIVQAVSRYGGIKIKDEWYNPVNKEGKEKVLSDKDKLAGSNVELALDNKGKIIGYTTVGEEKEKEKPKEEPRNGRPPSNQEMVVRENALRHAVSLVVAVYERKETVDLTPDDLTVLTLEVAEKVEEWIKRDV